MSNFSKQLKLGRIRQSRFMTAVNWNRLFFFRNSSSLHHIREEFKPKKALILTKVTRYEYEKSKHSPEISELEFEKFLQKRGSDYQSILNHHMIHKKNEKDLLVSLERRAVETKLVQRFNYTEASVNWADVIFTAGGDGTFLMGASKIKFPDKPLIGINTDPSRSEGHLLLSKDTSSSIEKAIDKLFNGEFRWFYRRRLRITLQGSRKIFEPHIELHKQQLVYPEYRYVEFVAEDKKDHPLKPSFPVDETPQFYSRILPVLALNEVFLGESLSSRVSYLEIKFDDKETFYKSRNSGLCISTGTGSTSWTFNINKLTYQAVESIFKIISENSVSSCGIDLKDQNLVNIVTTKFNNQLLFHPESNQMIYTIRDPVSVGTFPKINERKPRGFASKMEIKSRCFDASLVIDGSLSFKFDDGTRAIVEIFENDALRTVIL